MSDSSKSKFPCDPADIAALGLPPGDWDFSINGGIVMALPAGTFFVASNFRGKGFSTSRNVEVWFPDPCCSFFDGDEASAKNVIKFLSSEDRSTTEEGGAPGGAISRAETLKKLHEKSTRVQSDPVPDPILSDKFAEAVAFAINLHREHPRKGTTIPYASHLLAVASLVLEHGGSEIQAIAALLHDSIEDCAGLDPAPLKCVLMRE